MAGSASVGRDKEMLNVDHVITSWGELAPVLNELLSPVLAVRQVQIC